MVSGAAGAAQNSKIISNGSGVAAFRMQALIAEKEERKVLRDITRSKRRVDQYIDIASKIAMERRVYKRISVGRPGVFPWF